MAGAREARLPTADEEVPPRIVVHVDMDCFYAACERLREPALVGEPVVVGMGYDEEALSGAVATASYEAREYGVASAMPISEALERLPRRDDENGEADGGSGYYRPVDMGYYREVSEAVREILREFAVVFEPVSIDEAYLDVTERVTWAEVDAYAARIKDRIRDGVGVTASVGVAPTKSAAKVASDLDKPDGLTVVRPGEVRAFFEPLGVEQVHGIGPVTAGRLRELGIETAGDLAGADPEVLEAEFGSRGREFYDRAHGRDPRAVAPPGDPKSLSKESSFGDPVQGFVAKAERVRELAARVAVRAEEKNALYQTVGIKVVTPPYDVHTRDHSLSGPVQDAGLVEEIALELLGEFRDDPVRKVGVRVSGLAFSSREQSGLDRWEVRESGGARMGRSRVRGGVGGWRQVTLDEYAGASAVPDEG